LPINDWRTSTAGEDMTKPKGKPRPIPYERLPVTGDETIFRVREQRGIRHVDLTIMDDGLVGSDNPQNDIERQVIRLHTEAERILANKKLMTAQEVAADKAKNFDQAAGENLNGQIFYAISEWKKRIAGDFGRLSPEYLSANFLGWYHLNFFVGDVIADRADEKCMLVLSLCDAWHQLHMEVYGEHALAFQGEATARNLASAGTARSEEKRKRKAVIQKLFADYVKNLAGRKFSAPQAARRIINSVNGELEKLGLGNYTEDSLAKVIQEIQREAEQAVVEAPTTG
jgi:hypothetical protein